MAAAAVAGMPPSQSGVASAVLNTSRQVGGAVGIALLGAIFSSRFRATLPAGVGDAAGGAAGGLQVPDPAFRRVIGDAFVTALHTGYLVAGLALLTGTVLAVALLGALRRRRPAIPARAPANQVAAPRSG
jgi:predicted membrane protein